LPTKIVNQPLEIPAQLALKTAQLADQVVLQFLLL
jgi:hypothetical protein